MIRVTQFLRRPIPGFYSIERLYADVRAALPADFAVDRYQAKQDRQYPRGVKGLAP